MDKMNTVSNWKEYARSGDANRHQLFFCFRVKKSLLISKSKNLHCIGVQF